MVKLLFKFLYDVYILATKIGTRRLYIIFTSNKNKLISRAQ